MRWWDIGWVARMLLATLTAFGGGENIAKQLVHLVLHELTYLFEKNDLVL